MGKSKYVTWEDVKKRCRLDEETISKAKKLGMSPKTIMRNHSSTKHEKWKSSTKDWIIRIYEKKYEK